MPDYRMKFRLEMECDSQPFHEEDNGIAGDREVARVLRLLADRIDRGALRRGFGGAALYDDDGKTTQVGHCGYRGTAIIAQKPT